MGKGIRVGMNRDLVVKTENALLNMTAWTNKNIDSLRKDVEKMQDAQDLFYETLIAHTWEGRWRRLKKLLRGKR